MKTSEFPNGEYAAASLAESDQKPIIFSDQGEPVFAYPITGKSGIKLVLRIGEIAQGKTRFILLSTKKQMRTLAYAMLTASEDM